MYDGYIAVDHRVVKPIGGERLISFPSEECLMLIHAVMIRWHSVIPRIQWNDKSNNRLS